jgi:Ala-tRNA(Pro) deacylase
MSREAIVEVTDREQALISILEKLGATYEHFEHPPVFTCDEANALIAHLPGAKTKNLFLRNKKGDRHFLVVVLDSQEVDLRILGITLEAGKLGFASEERLMKYLGVTPGSVSLLALFNASPDTVEVFIDEQVWAARIIQAHPLRNTATFALQKPDVLKFLEALGQPFKIIAVPERNEEGMLRT